MGMLNGNINDGICCYICKKTPETRPDIQTLPRTDIVHQAMPQKIIPGIPLYYLYMTA